MPSPKNSFPASDAGFAEASPSFIQGFDATQFWAKSSSLPKPALAISG
jgi:hypothetical protein